MLDTTNWASYPFTVEGVEFVSLLDPKGSFYPQVERLPNGVFTQENMRMILELIGNPAKFSREELQAELDSVNLGAAASRIDKVDLPNTLEKGQNFLYDTTASNVQRVQAIKDAGYDIMMVMVYTNPIVSFLRNFKRERKVPTVGVLSSWNNVYKNIEAYKKMFGNDFHLISTGTTPEEDKMVAEFNKAFKSGKLKEFFEGLLSSGQFKSSFRKDPTQKKTPEEIAKSKALVDKQIDVLSNQFAQIEKQVEKMKEEDMTKVVNAAKSFIKK